MKGKASEDIRDMIKRGKVGFTQFRTAVENGTGGATLVMVQIQNVLPLLQTGLQGLIDLLITILPSLVTPAMQIILTISVELLQNLSQIINPGVNILLSLIYGLVDALLQLIEYLPTIIMKIIKTLMNKLP